MSVPSVVDSPVVRVAMDWRRVRPAICATRWDSGLQDDEPVASWISCVGKRGQDAARCDWEVSTECIGSHRSELTLADAGHAAPVANLAPDHSVEGLAAAPPGIHPSITYGHVAIMTTSAFRPISVGLPAERG